MSSSAPFSLLDWECPHCHRRRSPSSELMLFRGTCLHDVCCIRQIASEQGDDATASGGSAVEVSCPIEGCSGKFNARIDDDGGDAEDATYLASISKVKRARRGDQHDSQVIDLCDDGSSDDGSEAKPHTKPKRPRRAVSVKKEEEATPERITSIKTEKEESTNNVVSPLSSNNRSPLKPVFGLGDAVYAAWWDPKTDPKRRTKEASSWHPGKVKAFNEVGHNQYGPIRLYDIAFDDGDTINTLDDYWVWPKKDYKLQMKLSDKGLKPIGVKEVYDINSSDRWAKKVGWYEVTINGEARSFSRLSEAMEAHDDEVVRINGARTKESYLNRNLLELANEDKKVKHEPKGEPGGSVDEKKPPIKHELKEETDDDSRFSGGEEESAKPPKSKKMKREATGKVNFWDEVADPVDFSRHAFMTKPLFHLNTGIDGKVKHQNLWFSPFIREGIATPGFEEVPPSIAKMVPDWTYERIRDAINDINYGGENMRASCQVAMWLKDATVGSFIVMRHEFPKCPFTPARLKPNGKYIGPVYVIGVITQKILPGSAREWDIQDNQMAEYKRHYDNTFSLVDWRWMGMKGDLKEETKGYINAVCQPTINRMCQSATREYKGGATGESIRRDLWNNATERIRSEDFPDVFDVENTPHYDL